MCTGVGNRKSEFQHFKIAYVPPPRAHHSNKSTVMPNSFHIMFHSLSAQKLLPSFNIGILLALIQCLVCVYKERKRQYSTGKEITQVRRGEIIVSAVQYVINRIRALLNQIQRKKSMCTPTIPSEKMTSANAPHALQTNDITANDIIYCALKLLNASPPQNFENLFSPPLGRFSR